MADYELLRYRPELEEPKTERELQLEAPPPEEPESTLTLFPGVPPGALPFIEETPDEPVLERLNSLLEECRHLASALAREAPTLQGMTPRAYLSAPEEEAIAYEAQAIASGESLPAMLLPAAKDVMAAVEEAATLARELDLPADIPALKSALSEDLKKEDYSSASDKIVALALAHEFHGFADEVGALVNQLRETGRTAPIDALGPDPAAALQTIANNPQLRDQIQKAAAAMEKEGVSQTLSALQQRKRINTKKVLCKIRKVLPELLQKRQELNNLARSAASAGPAGAVFETLFAGSSNVLALLQSIIGDIYRVGALTRLEWGEYMDAGRNRYLVKQVGEISQQASRIGTEGAGGWLEKQAYLHRRPEL